MAPLRYTLSLPVNSGIEAGAQSPAAQQETRPLTVAVPSVKLRMPAQICR